MEHLDGIDLADVLSHERRLEPMRAAQDHHADLPGKRFEAAHAAGVIHRDLKPENIFLVARDGKADFVKVLDFGIARSIGQDSSRLTNPGIAMGTPEYMAPEQAMGGLADRRSDVYSVGALLYEMVTGEPPHGEEASALKKQEPPRPPRELRPELTEELELVILRALEADPAKRHQRMAALEYDLSKVQWGRARAVSGPARPAGAGRAPRTAAARTRSHAGGRGRAGWGPEAASARRARSVAPVGGVVARASVQVSPGGTPAAAAPRRGGGPRLGGRDHPAPRDDRRGRRHVPRAPEDTRDPDRRGRAPGGARRRARGARPAAQRRESSRTC